VGLSKPPATPYHRFQPIIEPNGMTKFSTCSQALKQSCKTTTRKSQGNKNQPWETPAMWTTK